MSVRRAMPSGTSFGLKRTVMSSRSLPETFMLSISMCSSAYPGRSVLSLLPVAGRVSTLEMRALNLTSILSISRRSWETNVAKGTSMALSPMRIFLHTGVPSASCQNFCRFCICRACSISCISSTACCRPFSISDRECSFFFLNSLITIVL